MIVGAFNEKWFIFDKLFKTLRLPKNPIYKLMYFFLPNQLIYMMSIYLLYSYSIIIFFILHFIITLFN